MARVLRLLVSMLFIFVLSVLAKKKVTKEVNVEVNMARHFIKGFIVLCCFV